MSALWHTVVRRTLLAALVLSPGLAGACSVPVFRYALERWSPDAYEAVLFHRGPLSADLQALADALQHTASNNLANLTLERVDLAATNSEAVLQLWRRQTASTLPWLVVQCPRSREMERPVWAGPLGDPVVRTLVDSPARRETAARLLKGDSAVWLFLESGDKARDDAVARLLEGESRQLEKILKLPEADPDDPRMRSDLPLKIAFSVVRFPRSNPAERMLLAMLTSGDDGLSTSKEPMVFGVFGRGRVLPPLLGTNLCAEVLQAVAEFVTGACSCQVKELNPGFDLLIAADWDALLEGRAVKDPELPPLIGLASFASGQTNMPATPLVAAQAPVVPRGPDAVARNLVVLLGAGVLGLLIATVVFRVRTCRKNSRLEPLNLAGGASVPASRGQATDRLAGTLAPPTQFLGEEVRKPPGSGPGSA
ncbi:MAG: hypothetical protein HZA90_26450 [Verrucomicrobia bacterium]|nr:hypothetical protein [Verrucomicrobiota bacterium]